MVYIFCIVVQGAGWRITGGQRTYHSYFHFNLAGGPRTITFNLDQSLLYLTNQTDRVTMTLTGQQVSTTAFAGWSGTHSPLEHYFAAFQGAANVFVYHASGGAAGTVTKYFHKTHAFKKGYQFAFSDDEDMLAASYRDGSIRFWSVKTGLPLGLHSTNKHLPSIVFLRGHM